MNKSWIIGLLVLNLGLKSYAQNLKQDSVYQLPEFSTQTNRFEQFSIGNKIIQTDSLLKATQNKATLAQLLALSSPLFIKNYGVGQLATTSFRGAGAAHTAILWNGINLQSNMNGQTDFNLIAVSVLDEVSVFYGGNSALYGSGAIGGAVLLKNASAFKKQSAYYRLGLGSFSDQQHYVGFAKGNAKMYIKLNAYWRNAINNITYKNTALPDNPLTTLPHAEQTSYGGIAEIGFNPNLKNTFSVKYWYGFSDRNIPPTIGSAVSNSYQIDAFNRMVSEWKYELKTIRVNTRAAYLNEYINYQDPSTYIFGKSKSNSWITESDIQWTPNTNWSFNTGVNNTFSYATSDGYSALAERNLTSFFLSSKYTGVRNITVAASIGKDWLYAIAQPFTSTLGVAYKLPKHFTISAHLNKSYRLPTLNDLYWITGNKNLKTENGIGEEVGLKKEIHATDFYFSTQANVFNRIVTDWIVWVPLSGTWTPQNLKQVWCRGVEWSNTLRYQSSIGNFTLRSDWSYVLSTNQKAAVVNDQTVGKQLIYTPRLTHQHFVSYSHKWFYFGINPTYTGYRFITSDNSAFIDDYFITNVYTGYNISWLKSHWQLQFNYNNCFNTQYMVLPARPMPLANWQLSLQLTFK